MMPAVLHKANDPNFQEPVLILGVINTGIVVVPRRGKVWLVPFDSDEFSVVVEWTRSNLVPPGYGGNGGR